jgi:hypothetical protein
VKVLSVLTSDTVGLSLSDGGSLPARPVDMAAPGPGAGAVMVVSFTLATPSPLVLSPLLAGQSVVRAGIVVTTTFDGVGAALPLGTPFSPAVILAAADSRPAAAGQYETDAVTSFGAPDTLQLVITPGAGATQGAGQVFFQLSG